MSYILFTNVKIPCKVDTNQHYILFSAGARFIVFVGPPIFLSAVHTTPKGSEDGGFTLETQQMFSVHSAPEEFKDRIITRRFGLYIVAFEKNTQNVLRPYENLKPAFSNSSGLKRVFEVLRFRDGLAWTVGLTVEIKLRLQIPPA